MPDQNSRQHLRRGWPLLLLLTTFFFLPYSTPAPTVKQSLQTFSMYHRAGFFSLWDAVLVFALVAVLFRQLRAGQLRFTLGQPAGVWSLFALLILAFCFGLLHVQGTPLGYGTTEARRAVIAFLPAVYLALAYLVAMNCIITPVEALQTLRWLRGLTLLLIGYGLLRFGLILAGEIDTMRPFGLPIVLYDQMTMLYPFLFAVPAWQLMAHQTNSEAGKPGRLEWLAWAVAVFFILISARRFNYLLLAAGLVLVLVAGPWLGWWPVRRSLKFSLHTLAVTAASAVLLSLTMPRWTTGVQQAVQSLDMTSALGRRHGGNIRQAEIHNLFANMERRPYSYLIGMGLGTKWQEIVEQPLDSFSYPKSYLASSRGWYPQFHLPYLAQLYRFGILGMSALLLWLVIYLGAHARGLQRLAAPQMRAFGLGLLLFLILHLPNLGDSANPTAAILAGLAMAVLERLPEAPASSSVESRE